MLSRSATRSIFALCLLVSFVGVLSVVDKLSPVAAILPPTPPPAGVVIVVNTTGDPTKPGPGICSLRDAIQASNSDGLAGACDGRGRPAGTADGIDFDIGSGTPLIQIDIAQLGVLPAITQPVTINGHTGGADRVEIRGPGGTTTVNDEYGFEVGGPDVTIKNMVVDGFRYYGVWISSSATNTTLLGNIIGLDASGTVKKPNLAFGVQNDGSDTVIGGATTGGPCAGGCNVISGNGVVDVWVNQGTVTIKGNFIGADISGTASFASYGLELGGSTTVVGGTNGTTPGGSCTGDCNLIPNGIYVGPTQNGDVIEGNFIGPDVTGTKSLTAPGETGIDVNGSNTTIGGITPAARNVIAGFSTGINTEIGAGPTMIEGNYIGTNSAGTAALPQVAAIFSQAQGTVIGGSYASAGNLISGNQIGVEIGLQYTGTVVAHNLIGTSADGAAPLPNTDQAVWIYGSSGNKVAQNTIEFNLKDGVQVFGYGGNSNGNWITENSIDDNGGLGIDLTDGGNTGIAAPVLQSAGFEGGPPGGETRVRGSWTSSPDSTLTIEIFVSPACDASGSGEGRQWVSAQTVSTDETGISNLDTTFSPPAPQGSVVTATTTDGNHTTSAFSNCVTAVGSPTPSPTLSPTPSPLATPTPTVTATPKPSPTTTPTPSPFHTATHSPGNILGDANCDGKVDPSDVIAVLSELAGVPPGAPCAQLADANCNERIDADDALRILAYIARTSPPQPSGCAAIGSRS